MLLWSLPRGLQMQFDHLKRREFITLLGGAVAWPLAAHGQRSQRLRRIGVLMPLAADDPEEQSRLTAFAQGLQEFGWSEGRNVRMEYRWTGGDAERARKYAAELVSIAPDIIFATGTPTVTPLLQLTRTLPIVFVQVADPVGAGLVESLSRPGGNATGFYAFEYAISAKWLELLREIAPPVKRVAVLRDATSAAGIGQFAAIQAVAASLGVPLTPVGVNDPDEIEHGVTTLARMSDSGLIITQSGLAIRYRKLIVDLAARHRLPAVFSLRQDAMSGGLISYGPDSVDPYRRPAGYVDRILKGEKPADLPVQGPTKHELVINLKTAQALGLDVPPSLLVRADEVIE
jgi:putative ABC transport system substrate-binding protein